jgi:uncharacterized membrane protein (DUF4010 family)
MLAGGVQSLGGSIILGGGFAIYTAVITSFGHDENRASGSSSATTVIAAMLTFALGEYAFLGDMRIAAAAGVTAAGLLAIREELHGWIERITWPELRSLFVLLAMTFIALPVVPNDPIGPFGGVNPREVWIIALILAGMSFFGYVAVKYFDARRGLLVSAIAGGIVSSTAVTIINARAAHAGEAPPRLLAAGVAIASAVMFVRVAVIVAALNPKILNFVVLALGAATVFACAFAWVAAYRPKAGVRQALKVEFRNPFNFLSVVGFAIFLGLVIVCGRAVGEYFGALGAILGAAGVGIADVDSVTVSVSRMTPQTLDASSAAFAVLSAVTTNTLSKVAIGAAIGRGHFAVQIAAMALGCFIAGGIGLWLTLLLVGR